jgi:uncharacterized protein (TIGR03643 family)
MNNWHEAPANSDQTNTVKKLLVSNFTVAEIDRIIEMAWEDRTSFEAIEVQFGLKEKDVIELMRKEMKPSSFRMWRKRHHGRSTKHAALRPDAVNRFKCKSQRVITLNKISKR